MAVQNTFSEKATKFLPLLDEVYQKEALTSSFETAGIEFDGTRKIKLPKLTMDGAGNYDRTEGYADGALNVEYGEYELKQDRGRKFRIDVLDNDEVAFDLFRLAVTEYVRTKEVPEIDAYRFAQVAMLAGNKVSVNYAEGDGLKAFDEAVLLLQDKEVALGDMVMFASHEFEKIIKQDPNIQRRYDVNVNNGRINRKVNSLDDIPIIGVPKGRFYEEIKLNDGRSNGQKEGGYVPASGASGINFILAPISSLKAITKRTNTKIIAPELNQSADAYDIMYRVFHDLIIYDNKRDGIFVSTKAGEEPTPTPKVK